MSSISAKILFESACRTYLGESAKWNLSSEVGNLLSACEQVSGIPHWVLRAAMAERTANILLRDLHDICSRDLRQNVSAEFCYEKRAGETTTERRIVRSPLLAIVSDYLNSLYYGTGGTADLHDRSSQEKHFLAYLGKRFLMVEEHYTAEFVQVLRDMIAEAKGGAA
jgi:hypothetical protein